MYKNYRADKETGLFKKKKGCNFFELQPFKSRAETRTRTGDLFITNELLYQLSHFGNLLFSDCKVTSFCEYANKTARFFCFFCRSLVVLAMGARLVNDSSKHTAIIYEYASSCTPFTARPLGSFKFLKATSQARASAVEHATLGTLGTLRAALSLGKCSSKMLR